MKKQTLFFVSAFVLAFAFAGPLHAQFKTPAQIQKENAENDSIFTRTRDVIYGEKHGTALTMDVFTPKKDAKGRGVIFVVSGGWVSARAMIEQFYPRELVKRGYTVFAVVMGSQPKFTVPELVEDLNRGVRFIRFHAKEYGVDPDKLGIYGGSAGGHLSLMIGTAGKEGAPKAADPVDRVSSRVQAVACFFPPTDFLNYGKEGAEALGTGTLAGFPAPFDFHEMSTATRRFERITDSAKRQEIGKAISPLYHVSKDDPPTLIVHGDKDLLVPYQQAQIFVAKMKEVGAVAELVTKTGAAHGWQASAAGPVWFDELKPHGDWFDKYLK